MAGLVARELGLGSELSGVEAWLCEFAVLFVLRVMTNLPRTQGLAKCFQCSHSDYPCLENDYELKVVSWTTKCGAMRKRMCLSKMI